MALLSLRETFPLLARHEGIWEGWYRHIDVNGIEIDAHRARLVCRLPKNDPSLYHQTNHYAWEDGRTEVRDFKGHAEGNKMVFDEQLIIGWATEVSEDDSGRTMMLHWTRNDDPNTYLYEMIQISDCGQFRTRVWQWLRRGKAIKRTLIDETRVSDSWEGE